MANRIAFTTPDHALGLVVHEGGTFSGPLPPESGEYRPIYERLLAQGVVPEPYAPAVASGPDEVTSAQARIALYEAGLLEEVEALVAAHPYPPVRIWFGHAKAWERDNPYVQAIGAELDLDDDAIDALFAAAALRA